MAAVVKLRYALNFAVACDAANVDAIKLLRGVHIDERMLENPENMISEYQLWVLAEEAAKATGRFDIGRQAGRISSVEQHGPLQEIFRHKTLYQRLVTFCHLARLEYSRADFFVHPCWNGLVFGRRRIAGSPEQVRQVELYVLEMMLETVRSVLGPDWEPKVLNLQSDHHANLEAVIGSGAVRMRFGQAETGIFLGNGEVAVGAREPALAAASGHSVTDVVSALVRTYLFDPRMTLSFVARLIDTNERKLQRDLQKEGTNFSQILIRERVQKAIDMLNNSEAPLHEISRRIGYSNQAHFTRAFLKATGLTPSHFRRCFIARN